MHNNSCADDTAGCVISSAHPPQALALPSTPGAGSSHGCVVRAAFHGFRRYQQIPVGSGIQQPPLQSIWSLLDGPGGTKLGSAGLSLCWCLCCVTVVQRGQTVTELWVSSSARPHLPLPQSPSGWKGIVKSLEGHRVGKRFYFLLKRKIYLISVEANICLISAEKLECENHQGGDGPCETRQCQGACGRNDYSINLFLRVGGDHSICVASLGLCRAVPPLCCGSQIFSF